jgi:RNA polymerase sigma-70 factor (ECF subfamily)
LEPYPDALLEGLESTDLGPEARYEASESTKLAFVAALQHLPPRQRCVLVLKDVLGFPAAEVAQILDTSEPSVRSALQRARATLQSRLASDGLPSTSSPHESEVVERFVVAVENGDIDAVVALLTDDAWLTMPPEPYEYQGPEPIGRFLDDRAGRRGGNLRLVPTRANTQPAFGCYLPDPDAAIADSYGLIVLTLRDDRISAITWFGDRSVMSRFGLPRTQPT